MNMTREMKMLSPQKSKQSMLTVPVNVTRNSSETISSFTTGSPSSRSSSFSHRLTFDSSPASKKSEVLAGYRLSKRESFPSGAVHKSNNDESSDKQQNHVLLTPYEKLVQALNHDQRVKWELAYGKRIGFYSLKGDIGTGNFSRVKIGLHALTKERVAIKILDKTKMDKKTKRLLSREIGSMEKLHHPHIIRLFEVMHTKTKLYLVMEYAGGGELFGRLSSHGKMHENDAKIIFSQILSAVEHMHQHRIIHRDLKAENVFFSDKRIVKVGDFGFSTKAHGSQDALDTFCGSPPYAAPELFRDSFYFGEYVDIWALGILLYFSVTGTMPFRAETVGKLKKRILLGHFTVPSHISSDCKHLIRNILKLAPSQRLSLKGIRQSSWLNTTSSPTATSYFNLDPTKVTRTEAQAEEAYALYMMERLGVKEEHMRQIGSGNNDNESLFSWHCDSETSSAGHDDTAGLPSQSTFDQSSAIVGTYRILLMRAHKKLIHSPKKEDILKLSTIASHVTGKECSLEKNIRLCAQCSKDETLHQSVSNGAVKNSEIQNGGNSQHSVPVSNSHKRSPVSEDGVTRQSGGVIKSKFCTIL